MNKAYDVIVIGSGHNGLTTAALLAKRGRKVLVVEKRATLGGLCASDEFHPGFRTSGVLHDTTGVRPWVVEQLDLNKYGLRLRSEETPVFVPQKSGRGILLWRDPARAEEEIAPHSHKDVKAYREYRKDLARLAPFLEKVLDDYPPDLMTMSFPGLVDLGKKALALRMLGKSDMMEVMRIVPMCVADYLNEYFETPVLKAGLSWPALHSSTTGPWSPGTNANLLMHEALYEKSVHGGPAALAAALEAAARGLGVEIRTNAEVQRIVLDGKKVRGVQLTSGETIEAQKIGAACDPKQLFLKLCDPADLSLTFASNVKNYRMRGTAAKIDLAVDRLPEWNGRPSLKAEIVRTGEYFDQMEKAYDFIKYGEFSPEPLLDIYVPTLENPSLAPNGKHVVQVLAHFVPYELRGGWTSERKDMLEKAVLAALEAYAPGFTRQIVGKRLLTPVDLEKDFALTGGQLHHGEHAADQLLVRPTPETQRYETPFAGLYLCGAGSFPGGGITCAPGALAAKTILG